MHNERRPWVRGLRTVAQVVLAALVVAVPGWLGMWDLDPTTKLFVGTVLAGLISTAQNLLDDRRAQAAEAPLTTGWTEPAEHHPPPG